ncbi:hypothetical protein SAMN05216316_0454 [Nitrosovibrio sp. Nv6]|nr:hypothetical protein SAMN05216316_0454 [Nitrosovibrio sp. Nv6]
MTEVQAEPIYELHAKRNRYHQRDSHQLYRSQ